MLHLVPDGTADDVDYTLPPLDLLKDFQCLHFVFCSGVLVCVCFGAIGAKWENGE
jgi:hypothetical protein